MRKMKVVHVEKLGTLKRHILALSSEYDISKAQFVYELGDSKIAIYGKTGEDGIAGQENKYEFPPPFDKELFFGDCYLVKYSAKDLKPQCLDIDEWREIYNNLYGGFEVLTGEDDENEREIEEERELLNDPTIQFTKEGYVKDGMIVDDDEVEDEDYEPPSNKKISKKGKLRKTKEVKSDNSVEIPEPVEIKKRIKKPKNTEKSSPTPPSSPTELPLQESMPESELQPKTEKKKTSKSKKTPATETPPATEKEQKKTPRVRKPKVVVPPLPLPLPLPTVTESLSEPQQVAIPEKEVKKTRSKKTAPPQPVETTQPINEISTTEPKPPKTKRETKPKKGTNKTKINEEQSTDSHITCENELTIEPYV